MIVQAVRFVAVWTAVAGLVWPISTTLLGGALFPAQASGSPVLRDGVVVGSSLVGQTFEGDGYLRGRPSAAKGDPTAAAGSNLGPSESALRERVQADADAIAAREGVARTAIPADALAASGSGLDPHISPEYAALQAPRVAHARHLRTEEVAAVIAEHTETGLGPARVNVLAVNLALDAR